jgi:hypothetical protein
MVRYFYIKRRTKVNLKTLDLLLQNKVSLLQTGSKPRVYEAGLVALARTRRNANFLFANDKKRKNDGPFDSFFE